MSKKEDKITFENLIGSIEKLGHTIIKLDKKKVSANKSDLFDGVFVSKKVKMINYTVSVDGIDGEVWFGVVENKFGNNYKTLNFDGMKAFANENDFAHCKYRNNVYFAIKKDATEKANTLFDKMFKVVRQFGQMHDVCELL